MLRREGRLAFTNTWLLFALRGSSFIHAHVRLLDCNYTLLSLVVLVDGFQPSSLLGCQVFLQETTFKSFPSYRSTSLVENLRLLSPTDWLLNLQTPATKVLNSFIWRYKELLELGGDPGTLCFARVRHPPQTEVYSLFITYGTSMKSLLTNSVAFYFLTLVDSISSRQCISS